MRKPEHADPLLAQGAGVFRKLSLLSARAHGIGIKSTNRHAAAPGTEPEQHPSRRING
jgi:hypothetical protein